MILRKLNIGHLFKHAQRAKIGRAHTPDMGFCDALVVTASYQHCENDNFQYPQNSSDDKVFYMTTFPFQCLNNNIEHFLV